MSATRTTIAGIPIPDSAMAREATELVNDVAPPLLFDHSRRVFLWGSLRGEKLNARISSSWHRSSACLPRCTEPSACATVMARFSSAMSLSAIALYFANT